MEWNDIAGIVFVCVTMNHLGLVSAVEAVIGRRIPVVDCPKCASFWCVLAYGLINLTEISGFISVLAVSFIASYSTIWIELAEGAVDQLYLKIYGKIYPTADTAADGAKRAQSAMPVLPGKEGYTACETRN